MRPDASGVPANSVILRGPRGSIYHLSHGDVVGRLWSAAMRIEDGRVSEVHAAVTLRGEDILLMGLRGRFKVDGRICQRVVLRAGQQISLAPGVHLQVVAVGHVREVLRIVGPDGAVHTVDSVAAMGGPDAPCIQSGWVDGATCHVWATADGWMRSTPDGPVPVVTGQTWRVHAETYTARVVSPADDHTQGVVARTPARIELAPSGVVVTVGADSVRLRGRSARIVRELATVALPMDWYALACSLWDGGTRAALRPRWDMQMLRLRDKLRQAGGRDDLVRADGTGLVELVLADGDTVVASTPT